MTVTTTVHRYSDPTPDAWDVVEAMHSGRAFECDQEMWYHWPELLPHVWVRRGVTPPAVPSRHQSSRF
jgi:hypothetical protein